MAKFESFEEAFANPGDVTELAVFELLHEIPDLTALVNLKVLNLSGCRQISEIPAWIGELRQLESLLFHCNMIEAVPEEVCRLENLKVLDMSYNMLTHIPDVSVMKSLEVLDVSYNPMVDLPELPRLKELVIVEGGWKDPAELVKRICQLTSLEVLYLDDVELEELPPEIGNLVNLKELNAANNHFVRLPDEIANLKNLKELYLEGCEDIKNEIRAIPEDEKQRLAGLLPDTEIIYDTPFEADPSEDGPPMSS